MAACPRPSSPRAAEERKAEKQQLLAKERKLQADQQRKYQASIFEAHARKYDAADINELSTYMEELYEEELDRKVHGLGMIAQLFRNAANFEALLSDASLPQARPPPHLRRLRTPHVGVTLPVGSLQEGYLHVC